MVCWAMRTTAAIVGTIVNIFLCVRFIYKERTADRGQRVLDVHSTVKMFAHNLNKPRKNWFSSWTSMSSSKPIFPSMFVFVYYSMHKWLKNCSVELMNFTRWWLDSYWLFEYICNWWIAILFIIIHILSAHTKIIDSDEMSADSKLNAFIAGQMELKVKQKCQKLNERIDKREMR